MRLLASLLLLLPVETFLIGMNPNHLSHVRGPSIVIKGSTLLFQTKKDENTKEVEVGSKEYLEGFISSPIQDGSVEQRGTGLEQGLKLAGSASVVLILLFVGFMFSNGLI